MSIIESTTSLQQQLTNARSEIHNLRKQLNTLQHVHRKDIDTITKTLENWQCSDCKKIKEMPCSSSFPANSEDFLFKPIGVISSEFPRLRGTPRQPTITKAAATLTLSKDVFTNPSHALQDLRSFSHMWIIFAFHKNSDHAKAKVAPPRLNGARTGVFATRSPHRPCPIGLSLVKIENIVDKVIYFTGVDMIDQTPVLDIKPYIPRYDQPTATLAPAQEICGTKVELVGRRGIFDGQGNIIGEQTELSSPSSDFIDQGDPDRAEDQNEAGSGPTATKVRVPSWIDRAPVHKLGVNFHPEAVTQLRVLEPELVDEKSRIISDVLHEDPRSVYLREKWGSNFYMWRIDNLCVTCKFNDSDHTVEIVKIVPFVTEPH